MEKTLPVLALALSGAIAVSAGAYAAQIGHPPGNFHQIAMAGPAPDLGSANGSRDVISPPSSVDPGMELDPPQTGARMPIIHPRTMPGGNMILPH